MPFLLRIFAPEQGTTEVALSDGNHLIGSGEDCSILFKHNSVHTKHAQLSIKGVNVHILPLSKSNPIFLNSKMVNTGPLKLSLGDSIQIGFFVFELISDESLRSPQAFRKRFDFLPKNMQLEIRSYNVAPQRIFMTGDTMIIGKGGILIPHEVGLSKERVHELKFLWPTGQSRNLYGEVMGEINIEDKSFTCIKLHKIEDFKEKKITNFQRTTWKKVF